MKSTAGRSPSTVPGTVFSEGDVRMLRLIRMRSLLAPDFR